MIKNVRCLIKTVLIFRNLLLAGIVLMAFPALASDVTFPKTVTAVSPSPGASVHSVMIGIGKAIQQETPIEKYSVQALGGPKTWLPMMEREQIQFANHNAADLLDAYLGDRRAYTGMKPQSFLRTVGLGHSYMFMWWATPNSGIKSLSDLKGKRCYVTQKGNPMFTNMAKTQLAAVGLTLDDLKSSMGYSSFAEATQALIEGRADALMGPVVPTFVMQINEALGETNFISPTDEEAKYIIDHLPGYTIETVKANDMRFRNKRAVKNAIFFQNGMFTHKNMDPDVIYEITKVVYEKNDIYADSHPQSKYWSLDYKPVGKTIPYHPGSIKFFKEKGLWTQEMEEYQEKMLNMPQ